MSTQPFLLNSLRWLGRVHRGSATLILPETRCPMVRVAPFTFYSAGAPEPCLECRFKRDDLAAPLPAPGAGDSCYATQSDCELGMNACGPGNGTVRCMLEYAMCSTGVAAGQADFNWFCQLDVLPGSAPTGSGIYCHETSNGCMGGRNVRGRASFCLSVYVTTGCFDCFDFTNDAPKWHPRGGCRICTALTLHLPCPLSIDSASARRLFLQGCNEDSPCQLLPSTCHSGLAAEGFHNWMCASDMPNGSLPTAGGQLCYASKVRLASDRWFNTRPRPFVNSSPPTVESHGRQ